MQPIYNEFINFLETKTGQSLDISEGTYWLDNHKIVAFDTNGELHALYRYKVDENLNVTIKKLPIEEDVKFETWDLTVARMSDRINQITDEAKTKIKNCFYLFK